MASTKNTLKPGDWVEVKTPQDIAETLDAEGTLDWLSFMPEMVEFCGRRFRVLRQAFKTCLEAAPCILAAAGCIGWGR